MALTLVGYGVLQALRDKFRGLEQLEEEYLRLLSALTVEALTSRSI